MTDKVQKEPKFKVGDTIRYLVDGDIRTIIKVREDNYKLDDCSILHFNAQDNWELVEEPVSTKDKLLALSDGRLHLGWIDDAKVVEFEECLMQFHEDMNNIPQGTDSLTRLKDTDGVLHSYSKKLMSMAKEESVSEDLEEASKEWLRPQLDKSYVNYGEAKMMELTHFDGYAMLDAIEFGAKWQRQQDNNDANHALVEQIKTQQMWYEKGMADMKQQLMAKAVNAVVSQVPCSNEIILRNPASVHWSYLPYEMNKLGLDKGDKVKVIVTKED